MLYSLSHALAAPCAGNFPPMGEPQLMSGGVDSWFAKALEAAHSVIAGACARPVPCTTTPLFTRDRSIQHTTPEVFWDLGGKDMQ